MAAAFRSPSNMVMAPGGFKVKRSQTWKGAAKSADQIVVLMEVASSVLVGPDAPTILRAGTNELVISFCIIGVIAVSAT